MTDQNSVNCVLTMFGSCSYNETGCSDCEVKSKIRKALNDRPQGTWMFDEKGYFYCDQCGKYPHDQYATTEFCPKCGACMQNR